MTDVFSEEKRSAIMARVKSKNTKPELLVRSALHRLGYRFRIHRNDLPGKPDIVLPRHKTVIFVNGCFWHGHPGCNRSKLPTSRSDFWRNKIQTNIARDRKAHSELLERGWHVVIIWDCQIGGRSGLTETLLESIHGA